MLQLSDDQWERIREHFPEENIPADRPGPRPVPTRQVLEAVLWILNTGAQWHMLPQCYPNYKCIVAFSNSASEKYCERSWSIWRTSCAIEAPLTSGSASSMRRLPAPRVGRRDRQHAPWQGRQDHGHCGPPWIAGVGEYVCGEPS